VSESDAADLVPPEVKRRRGVRWKAVIGLASMAGLIVVTVTTVNDAREQALPGVLPLVIALTLQFVAMICAARGWVALFPGDADRTALSHGLYASQLTKYLPAGGFVQAASQVALSSQTATVGAAALRLPVFSVCSVVAAATVGSLLAFANALPDWARLLAILGLSLLALLDLRVMAAALRLARRLVGRLPGPEHLPHQRAILRCYFYVLANQIAYATAFVVLVGDLGDVDLLAAGAAFSAGWAIGYLALPLPSGLLVREAVLIAALPGLATATLLASSVAHRLTGFIAEAALAMRSHVRTARRGNADASAEGTSTDTTGS
jgi:uncharacterized membrane protein YbhN (UPF0104 family)